MSVTIRGLDQFKNWLDNISKEIEEQAKLQVLDSATAIEMNAKALAAIGAPIDKVAVKEGFGSVIGYQGVVPKGKYTESGKLMGPLTPFSPMWAYMEFGTGESAEEYLAGMEPEVKAMARQFYVNGRGTIIARPALIPAFFRERGKFVQEMRKLVLKATKR